VQRRRRRQLRLFEEPEETVVRELRELRTDELEPTLALELIRKWREALGIPEQNPDQPSAVNRQSSTVNPQPPIPNPQSDAGP
jgi:hypothetical protein